MHLRMQCVPERLDEAVRIPLALGDVQWKVGDEYAKEAFGMSVRL